MRADQLPKSNCTIDMSDMRGYSGLGGWDPLTAAEENLWQVCQNNGLRFRYIWDSYVGRSQVPGIELEKGQILHRIIVHVGEAISSDAPTLEERYIEIASYLRDTYYSGFQFNTTEEASSDKLGPGLYQLDLLCAELGWHWSLVGSWHSSIVDVNNLDGTVVVGPLLGFVGPDRDEILYAIAQSIEATT